MEGVERIDAGVDSDGWVGLRVGEASRRTGDWSAKIYTETALRR